LNVGHDMAKPVACGQDFFSDLRSFLHV